MRYSIDHAEVHLQRNRNKREEAHMEGTQNNLQEMQSSVQLLREWLDIHLDMEETERGAIHTFLISCQNSIATLYKLHEALYVWEEKSMSVAGRYSFGIESDKAWLLYEQGKISMPTEEWRRIVARGIQFLEELLPLGSVAELKKDVLLQQIPALKAVDRVRVVITDRYIPISEKSYYPYESVPYPVGAGGRKQRIYFTPSMIERVVSRGYADEQEEAFRRFIQRAYLLEKDMDSAGFAAGEDQKGGAA